MYGIAEGICNFVIIFQLVGRCSANISRSNGSVSSRPVSVFARIGNNDTMKADALTVVSPKPNQITSSGAIAMIGTV